MSNGSNYLDPDRPGAVRLSIGDARAFGEAALAPIGYGADDARIITDQLIDNALCGYRFAGLPRILAIAREAKTRDARVPVAVAHETPVSALYAAHPARFRLVKPVDPTGPAVADTIARVQSQRSGSVHRACLRL
jgi:hypothetical protein